MKKPHLIYLFADQLRADATPLYGPCGVQLPNLERLRSEGTVLTQAISTCPICVPYRAMLLTGRHPQSTGHFGNFITTRHDEISIGDAFARAGYRTGWVGKWHLHAGRATGGDRDEPEDIPAGRDRLGFDYFRAYNYHTQYENGWLCGGPGGPERWRGYETEGLWRYAHEFLTTPGEHPFCLFISPHQPHLTKHGTFAPDDCFARLPAEIPIPAHTPGVPAAHVRAMWRNYWAMVVAIDDLLGKLLDVLDERGLSDDTLLVFGSDHGTMGGARGLDPWCKKLPYEESIRVPLAARWPGRLAAGQTCDALIAPVDLFPTLAGLCGVPTPGGLEGLDGSAAWQGRSGGPGQEEVLTMNFIGHPDLPLPAGHPQYRPHYEPWRGVRTARYSYVRWLSDREALFDLEEDPGQMRNLIAEPNAAPVRDRLRTRLAELLARRGDAFPPSEAYADWLDAQRRVVRNAFGSLPPPEQPPDWTRFVPASMDGKCENPDKCC